MSLSDDNILKKLGIGMRIIKTVLSIFISLMISLMIKGQPTNSTVAALICVRQSDKETLHIGTSRIIGTIFGGIFSEIFLLICHFFNIKLFTISYYTIICLLLIPIMKFMLIIKKPDAARYASIVTLLTLLSYAKQKNAYHHVFLRIVDTMIGVVVAIIVNKLLPYKKEEKKE